MGERLRIDQVVTTGTFNLDGGSWEVENNVWLVGDDAHVVVIDAAHDAEAILQAVDGRDVLAIVCTHAQSPEAILAPKTIGAADLGRCEETGAAIAAGLALGVF